MTELYRNEIGVVSINLPVGTTVITAEMIENGGTIALTEVNYNSADLTASVTLPFSMTSIDHEFDIRFGFTIGSEAVTIIEHVSVVTPLISRIKAELIAPGRYEEVEPIIRHIIEAYTGQYFGKWQGILNVYGEDELELQLPYRLISLNTIVYNGVSRTADSYLIKGDRNYLARNTRRFTEDETFTTVDPIEYPFSGNKHFREYAEYSINGVWGYESVPIPVEKAALVLFKDYVCNEATYRDRYVGDISAQDWKIKFSNRTWDGTGNVIADQLLAQYRKSGMIII